MMINRVALFVLDSVGVGELPDARDYGDCGSNTLGNISRAVGGLNMPHLGRLGLGNIIPIEGVPPAAAPAASYGRMAEKSPGKDTTTGHWEMAGMILKQPFPVYPHGFPAFLIKSYEGKIGRRVLGNKAASDAAIIEELGAEHMATGSPIVYTSADSVFQVAAHEEVIPLEELYRICRIAREMLRGEHAVGRVIARPFVGQPGNFRRTVNRHDFSLKPPGYTLLDLLVDKGIPVTAVGKIRDVFAGQGITHTVSTKGNDEGMDKSLQLIKSDTRGLIFTNLVDFDMLYGHRNNPRGYGDALEEFDCWLPRLLEALKEDDVLMITADHGCDPTTPSTDHSREYVPILIYGKRILGGVNLGVRETFADIAATIAEAFGLQFDVGQSFWQQVYRGQ
ncbi:MAG: phosphopentomutase [Candidatus Syntrophopropionicum ammoniitolerans]